MADSDDWTAFSEHGIEKILWEMADSSGLGKTRRITFVFTDGVRVHDDLWPNEAQTEYASVDIPKEWQQHGIEAVWVQVKSGKSAIYVRMRGRPQPLHCLKDY